MYSVISILALVALSQLTVAQTTTACASVSLPAPSSLPQTSTLPDPFTYRDGSRVTGRADWPKRRCELMNILQKYEYGYYPDHTLETVTSSRSGTSLTVNVAAGGKSASFKATINLPSGASSSAPVPVVIATGGIQDSTFTGAGIATVNFNYGDVAADSTSKSGAFWTLYSGRDIGVLTAWGWGYHRVLDAIIQSVPEINSAKVGVTGCSRWGKGAVAAGLFDDRITLTIPMSSGMEGLAPFRYFYESGGSNEHLQNANGYAVWWTNSQMTAFVNQESKLPYDTHSIVAAIAPRAIIWDQGQSDYWTNPEGVVAVTFPAAKVVYDWLGQSGQIGVAVRSGGHCDAAGYSNVLPFVSKILKGVSTTRDYTSVSPYNAHTETFPWRTNLPAQ